jgi:hypothetical protein
MTQTVAALYDTYDSAVAAVNALEAAGIPHSDISIVSPCVILDSERGESRRVKTAQQG